MTDKTRWLGLGPWHEDNESELIDWTAQPQYKGLVKGDYYHAELRYSGRWGDPGHKGELDVVFDDDGKIAFAEFNETTMGNYYVRHFQNVSKRRTEFQFFQDFHDKRRSVAYGRVLANGFKYVEDQILEKQALDFLRTSFENLGMTARAYDRVVKVARTIADLAGEEQIAKKHVAEALAYRALDQKYWYENNNVL